MKRISLPIIALIAAFCAFAPNASAIGAAPTVTITAPAAGGQFNAPPALTFTTTGTAVQKTCTLTGPGVDEYEEGCSSGYRPLSTLPDGTYSYGISVTNTDGTDGKSRSFTIDHTNPQVTILSGVTDGVLTNIGTMTYKGSYSDANLASFVCLLDGIDKSCGLTGEFNVLYSGLGEGVHTFVVTATDKAGNTKSVTRTITVDKTKPSASIALVGLGSETNDNTPAFTISGSDAHGPVVKRCSIETQIDWVACDGDTWVVPDAIADGAISAWVEVTDKAGNQSYAFYGFDLDASMPLVSYGGVENDRTTNTSPDIEFWVDDAHETTAKCGFDPADWDALADCEEGAGHVPAAPLAVGSHAFWISATDSFGNVSSTIYGFEVYVPTAENPGGSGGQAGGTGNGGAAGATPAVTLKTSSTKVKKGKFTLTVVVTATNTSCRNAEIVIAPKVKKAKAFMIRSAAKSRGGACVATAKIKLAAKFKKKKAAITAAQGGASTKLTIKL